MSRPRIVTMLGMDPGYRNYGIALVTLDRKTGRIKVVRNSMLAHPVDTFTDGYKDSIVAFLHEIRTWIKRGEPHGFIAERFQSRGIRGLSAEAVSFMLGLMASHFGNIPHKYITASTWKNDINKKLKAGGTDLKALYKEVEVQPHQLDAVLIAAYGLGRATNTEIKYDWDKLLTQVNQTGEWK